MLNLNQKQSLYNAGFTAQEIDKLNKATTSSLDSPAWKSAIQNRINFANKARTVYKKTHGIDLNRARYSHIVNMTFRGNIFDWLKLTYIPRKKTDFQDALKARLKRKESSLKRRFTR